MGNRRCRLRPVRAKVSLRNLCPSMAKVTLPSTQGEALGWAFVDLSGFFWIYADNYIFFCWVVFSFFLALHHPFQYLSRFCRDKPIPPIVPYVKKLPIGSEAPVELWTFDSAAENNNTAATIPSPSLRPRDAIASPFVPCQGIPYHLLHPVPGRLRPPQWVVLRQGLQPVKKTSPSN